MILERLIVNNFRVFHGEHTFDLTPRVKYHKKRPIILFGGLNGAGKTTTLTAVRLALYGKQSLGPSVANKDYQAYLRKSIHRSKADVAVQPSSASIQLSFSYASMGTLKHYTVHRSWQTQKQGVKERLTISEDGKLLSDLNAEQCQGFLNELIPIGVSDLFFFDGEKIAELAEDTKGEALGDSIKKLLGLDLLETLDADLGILIRNEAKKNGAEEAQDQIASLENELVELKQKAADEIAAFQQLKPREIEATKLLSRLEAELSSKGGAWAATREETIRRQATLTEERKHIEQRLREVMADTFPFVLAKDFVLATLKQIKEEARGKQTQHTAKAVSERIDSLKKQVASIISSADAERIVAMIETEFAPITANEESIHLLHDVSDRLLGQMETVTNDALTHKAPLVSQLAERLDEIHDELDRAGKQIARAPEQDQIRPLVAQIREADEARTIARTKQRTHLENQKRYLREAISVARQLEKANDKLVSEETKSRTLRYASNAKVLIRDFASETAKRKIKDLEAEFVESFHRLARKDDINLHARINPTNFAVTLQRADGTEIDKDELSAGEKQIYAISILEALARTSGRHLPIIIDTPLGRLDSIHRSKLIDQYFPNASHQVIILSTDTEVDEAFYADLSPNISHAFKLDYDNTSGATTASEGYFWRDEWSKAKAS